MTEERLCVICQRRQYERAHVCEPCRTFAADVVADIGQLWPQLPEAFEPARGAGQKVSGSREAPLPLNVDALDLTLAPRVGTIRDPYGDQVGNLPVAAILDTIVRDWIGYRHKGEHLPLPTVPSLVRWIADRVEWACDHHPAIDETVQELQETRAAMRAETLLTVEEGERPPYRRPEERVAPCPECDNVSLWWWPQDERVRCDSCPRVMIEDEYARWARMVHATARKAS